MIVSLLFCPSNSVTKICNRYGTFSKCWIRLDTISCLILSTPKRIKSKWGFLSIEMSCIVWKKPPRKLSKGQKTSHLLINGFALAKRLVLDETRWPSCVYSPLYTQKNTRYWLFVIQQVEKVCLLTTGLICEFQGFEQNASLRRNVARLGTSTWTVLYLFKHKCAQCF